MIVNITGERIALGPLERETYIACQYRWLNDFATLRSMWERAPVPMTMEQVTRLYERISADAHAAHFTVYARASGQPIGFTSLRDIDDRNRSAEFAVMIGDPAMRGKGYGTGTTRLMLDYAFTALGLHNVLLTAAAFNPSGLRAYERAGFREIGRRRECWLMRGQRYDEVFMDCLATDFESTHVRHIFVPDAPHP